MIIVSSGVEAFLFSQKFFSNWAAFQIIEKKSIIWNFYMDFSPELKFENDYHG